MSPATPPAALRTDALDLSGQCIALTGGSGALGQAIAATLQAHGARVFVLDPAPPPAPEATEAPGEVSGIRHPVERIVTDAAEPGEVDHALDEILARSGTLPTTVLCHAGEVGTHELLDYPLDEYDRLMRTNVRGAYVTARQAARRWRDANLPGHLVFTTSWVHRVPWPEIGPYTASKAAVVQLTRAFARELAPHGIRANAMAPGIVGAGMAKHQWDTDEDYRRRASRAVPLGSLQTPQSVADAFLFLCSDLAAYMTGSVLTVDGGASLYPMD